MDLILQAEDTEGKFPSLLRFDIAPLIEVHVAEEEVCPMRGFSPTDGADTEEQ